MRRYSLVPILLAALAFPLFAGDSQDTMTRLQSLQMESGEVLPVRARAGVFSALGALPYDTDSFFALSHLGELADFLQRETSGISGAELATGLDGFAIGVSARTLRDLQHLKPLFEVVAAAQTDWVDIWGESANDEAARAIVAVQREQMAADGEKLVQATRDFHMAPIYFVLTAKPESLGEALLQQLCVLPLMVPMGSDAPIEMTMKAGWRGFCVQGDWMDLSNAGLSPEHELQVKKNLANARLYVVSRMVADKLVLAICSNLDEVKIPSRLDNSVLASPVMAGFDTAMKRDSWVVGYSSPAVVKLREESDLFDYQYAASFMEKVFSRLGSGNAACATAASSVKALMEMVKSVLPHQHGAERLAVWKDDGICLHLICESDSTQFATGRLRFLHHANAPGTVIYAETTPVNSSSSVDVPAVLNHVENVQKGYIDTVKTERAAEVRESMALLQQHRRAVELIASIMQKLGGAMHDSSAILVQETALDNKFAAAGYMRADLTDAARGRELESMLQSACKELADDAESGIQFKVDDKTLHLSYYGGESPLLCEMEAPVSAAGAIMSVNVPALARVLEREAGRTQDTDVAETAESLYELSQYVQRIEAAATTVDKKTHMLLRVIQSGDNK